jgi:hypothetical protein
VISFGGPADGYPKEWMEVSAMPKGRTAGSSVKKPKTYEALRDKGMSKERAAKISNAQSNREKKSKKSR